MRIQIMNRRPIAVTILGWILIAAGVAGVAYHATEFNPSHTLPPEYVWILLVRILAIVSGVFILRGSNWARWLALAWIAFHVAISFLDSWQKVAMHGLILVLFAYLLFRPEASAYFRGPGKDGS
jgi:hypothetical protein